MGFAQTISYPCLYISTEVELFVNAVYVHDIVLAGMSDRSMSEIKKALASRFDVKDMDTLNYFLDVKIIQDQRGGKVWIVLPAHRSTDREHPAEILQCGECKPGQHARCRWNKASEK